MPLTYVCYVFHTTVAETQLHAPHLAKKRSLETRSGTLLLEGGDSPATENNSCTCTFNKQESPEMLRQLKNVLIVYVYIYGN